jgi:hypothetical protein
VTLKCLRNPTQVNGDSVNDIRTEKSRNFTNKEEYVLKTKLSASKKSKGGTFDNI